MCYAPAASSVRTPIWLTARLTQSPSVVVTMSIHKLSAGSGYDYLTRQVAVLDATEKGYVGLASYYTERGEETPDRPARHLQISNDQDQLQERGNRHFWECQPASAHRLFRWTALLFGGPAMAAALCDLWSPLWAFSGGMESLEAVKEQIEPEFELDLVVAPAQRGVFVVVSGLDDCDFGHVGILVGQVTAHDRSHV
jgi:hypothetical protein